MNKEIRICKIYPDARLPIRKHPNDAGLDLFCYANRVNLQEIVHEQDYHILGTGIKIEIPEGYVGQIWPKSSSNLLVGGGIIDAGYKGEILVKVFNPMYNGDILIFDGDPIAQLVILPVETPEIKEVDEKEFDSIKSDRGETGGILTQVSNATVITIDDPLPKEAYLGGYDITPFGSILNRRYTPGSDESKWISFNLLEFND
jgi:dUTP pyrophosphatase